MTESTRGQGLPIGARLNSEHCRRCGQTVRPRLSCQCHQITAPIPTITAKTSSNSKAEFSIHAIAGMPNAMIKPSRQTCQERMCTPAVKVRSASNVKTARPVEVAFKTLCTLAKNTMFITIGARG
jgi:hypothetical protein